MLTPLLFVNAKVVNIKAPAVGAHIVVFNFFVNAKGITLNAVVLINANKNRPALIVQDFYKLSVCIFF